MSTFEDIFYYMLFFICAVIGVNVCFAVYDAIGEDTQTATAIPTTEVKSASPSSVSGHASLSRSCSSAPYVKYVYPAFEGGDVYGGLERIELINNENATNPTYADVMTFMKTDMTDQKAYNSTYVCANYARDVHNNAEAAGLKCAFVVLNFRGTEIGHACNVFDTSDRGLIFVDCTCFDSTVPNFATGNSYTPVPLDKNAYCESLGTTANYQIYF